MIISKTPLRISFAGGMTDIPAFYEKGTGAVVSATIDKYIYVCVMPKLIGKSRIAYRKYEEVESNEDITHPIIREALKLLNIQEKIEITSIADIPAGTGLGSSSAFTVGLLNALYKYKGYDATPSELAKQACKIEMDILKEPIGKQDQYATAFGGLNYIQFTSDDVILQPIHITKKELDSLNEQLFLFYLGNTEKAKNVLKEQIKQFDDNFDNLLRLTIIAKSMVAYLNKGEFHSFGVLLNEAWKIKKQMKGVTNDSIDEIYDTAINSGATGGKVCGAGGRGFLLLYYGIQWKKNIMISNYGLKKLDFRFEKDGSKIIYAD